MFMIKIDTTFEDRLSSEEAFQISWLFSLSKLLNDHVQILLYNFDLINNLRVVEHQRSRWRFGNLELLHYLTIFRITLQNFTFQVGQVFVVTIVLLSQIRYVGIEATVLPHQEVGHLSQGHTI